MRQPHVRTRDDRPGQLGRESAGLSRHVTGEPRLRQHPAQGGCQRIRVIMADDDAGPTGEELDGVRERGGHNWTAARDGVDQHTGGDLIGRVVGQDDDRGGLDEVGQHRNVAVSRVEAHRIGDAAAPCLFGASVAVGLAIGGQHLRMRSARNQVPRPPGQIIEGPHRVDHPLDALARPQQSPGQQGRSTASHDGAVRRNGRAVRDGGDFAAIDIEAMA